MKLALATILAALVLFGSLMYYEVLDQKNEKLKKEVDAIKESLEKHKVTKTVF